MNQDRFQELVNRFIEAEISQQELSQLRSILATNPAAVREMRSQLEFADFLEQNLNPGRSFGAFIDGLETRVEAEQTAESFVNSLICKLREVDRRSAAREPRVIPMPVHARPPLWIWTSAAAAAAIALIAVAATLIMPNKQADSEVVRLTETENVVWGYPVWGEPGQTEGPIEWRVGSGVRAGISLRLESGVARFEARNGNVFTVEGPTEIRFDSDSQGYLQQGKFLADVSEQSEPFVLNSPNVVLQVDHGATWIETDGNHLQASMHHDVGKLMAMGNRHGGTAPEQPLRAAGGELAGLDGSGSDAAAAPQEAPLLSGISDHSEEVQLKAPRGLEPVRDQTAPIVLSLEQQEPLMEIAPSDLARGRDVTMAARTADPVLPQEGRKMKSYLIKLNALPGAEPAKDLDAYVTFDQPIVGISATAAPQRDDTSQQAVPDQEQAEPRSVEQEYQLRIRPDGRTLDLKIKAEKRLQGGQVRVLVRGE